MPKSWWILLHSPIQILTTTFDMYFNFYLFESLVLFSSANRLNARQRYIIYMRARQRSTLRRIEHMFTHRHCRTSAMRSTNSKIVSATWKSGIFINCCYFSKRFALDVVHIAHCVCVCVCEVCGRCLTPSLAKNFTYENTHTHTVDVASLIRNKVKWMLRPVFVHSVFLHNMEMHRD